MSIIENIKIDGRTVIMELNLPTAIVNALRCVITEEIGTWKLYFDVHKLNTSEEYIIKDELLQTMISLPVIQKQLSTALFAENKTSKNMRVTTRHLKDSDKLGFAFELPITELQPGRYIRIDHIETELHPGLHDHKHNLTSVVRWWPIDYCKCYIMRDNGGVIKGMVKISEVEKIAKQQKKKVDFENPWDQTKICFVPYPELYKLKPVQERLKHMKYVLDGKIQFAQSSVSDPQRWTYGYKTYGNVEPLYPLHEAIKYIISKLETIKTLVNFEEGDICVFRNVTSQMMNMIKYQIYKENPKANITGDTVHPTRLDERLNIKHPDKEKMTKNAIDNCITIFKKFGKELSAFSGS